MPISVVKVVGDGETIGVVVRDGVSICVVDIVVSIILSENTNQFHYRSQYSHTSIVHPYCFYSIIIYIRF